jgi:hypothetical protein
MKKITAFSVAFLLLGIYLIAVNGDWMGKIYNSGYFPNINQYGDLYKFSSLKKFKIQTQFPYLDKKGYYWCEPDSTPHPEKVKNTLLYIIGDSFTAPIIMTPDMFASEYFTHHHIYFPPTTIAVDSNHRNILIIEVVEKHLPICFGKSGTFSTEKLTQVRSLKQKIGDRVLKPVDNKITNQNLEYLLFSYPVFDGIKETKAAFNKNIFGKTDVNVSLSRDESNLLHIDESDTLHAGSSFEKISNSKIDSLVSSINEAYLRYKNMGFDEIYLSLIPNKTSIVAPDLFTYNHIIERIQHHPALKIPVIDVYSMLKSQHSEKKPLYHPSDIHWNCMGRNFWLNYVNNQIVKREKEQ